MKKRILASILATVLAVATMTGCSKGGDSKGNESAGDFELKANVQFMVSSKAGGGSDIFTRTITDIAEKNNLVNKSFVVNNLVDGAGQIARREVKDAKGNATDATLLCFSTGDLSSMLSNGGLTMKDFKPISILAADKQLLFTNSSNKDYPDFQSVIDAAKSGKQIVVGGTSSDEKNVYDMLIKELGLENNFSYIVYGSASETITALLGGHVDLGVAKPAASREYVISKDIIPVLALSNERFAEPFQDAPTTEELGYGVIELPVWRGVIGSANMSEEAVAFWSDVFKQITETEQWQKDYIEKNLLVNNFMDVTETTATMLATEEEVLKTQK